MQLCRNFSIIRPCMLLATGQVLALFVWFLARCMSCGSVLANRSSKNVIDKFDSVDISSAFRSSEFSLYRYCWEAAKTQLRSRRPLLNQEDLILAFSIRYFSAGNYPADRASRQRVMQTASEPLKLKNDQIKRVLVSEKLWIWAAFLIAWLKADERNATLVFGSCSVLRLRRFSWKSLEW